MKKKLQLEKELTEIEWRLNEKQKELQETTKTIFQGQGIRSCAKLIENGENPTKYCLNWNSRYCISVQIL